MPDDQQNLTPAPTTAVPQSTVAPQIAPATAPSFNIPPSDPKAAQEARDMAKENIKNREGQTKEMTFWKEEQEELNKKISSGLASVRDIIAPAAFSVTPNYVQLGEQYLKTMFVFTYPRYLETNWLSPIINYDISVDIGMYIHPLETKNVMQDLKGQIGKLESTRQIEAEKGGPSDPEIDTALGDIESLRDVLQKGEIRLFQFGLYFTVYAKTPDELHTIVEQLESTLGGMLIYTKESMFQMEQGFNTTLPLMRDELNVLRNFDTGSLSSTFPFTSTELTQDDGILYGINRHNNSLIIFDRFSLENANSVVFAKSGAGKSYAVKLEILRQMMFGVDVIVIDPENEYEALSQTVGGSYLKLSLNSDRRINPFDLPAPLPDEEVQPGDILRQNVIGLIGLLKIMLGGVTPEEEGILDRAIINVYAIKGITMDLVDPSKVEPPTMEDLYDTLTSTEGAQGLTQKLQKYTTGTYGGIFNKHTNIDLTTGMMVFCIRDLDDNLRPIAMYIILNYIWSKIRRELKKRILIIDEAWSLMQHED